MDFDLKHQAHSMAQPADHRCGKVPVTSIRFSMQNRIELLKLSNIGEDTLRASLTTNWLSSAFFEAEFRFMCVTTFAFQPSHVAVECKRYLHRFMLKFSRVDTLAGFKRMVFNQYDSRVLPSQAWLKAQGVRLVRNCGVREIEHATVKGQFDQRRKMP